MPYHDLFDLHDNLGAARGGIVGQLRQAYRGIPKKRRLNWLKKRIEKIQKAISQFEARLAKAEKKSARKFFSNAIKARGKALNVLNEWLQREEQRLGVAPPVEAVTAQQVDVAIEQGKKEVAREKFIEMRERTAPAPVWQQREGRARQRRIFTPLTELMTKIEASTDGYPFRMRLKPVVREGTAHTMVEVEALDVSPDAVKNYSLFRRNGELIIEPITESLPARAAGLGVIPAAAAAIPVAVETATTAIKVGQEELSKVVKQAGESFSIDEFIKNNIGDIKEELSDKVHKLTGGLAGKKKKKIKWYMKHGWKNAPPKDCPRYKDKTGNKHCMHRLAYKLWKKLGKPSLLYGTRKLAGMRALEVIVGTRKKKQWLFPVKTKKAREMGFTHYDAINWAQQNIPGFDPAAAGVPTEALSAKEIEAANAAAGENPVVLPEPPFLETTVGKAAVGGGAILFARAFGLF